MQRIKCKWQTVLTVTVICIFAFLTWRVFSPFPKVSTQARLRSFPTKNIPLHSSANVYWNDRQVPFIDAKTDEDAAFLLGMVQAHLRLGQMEMVRRLAYGRLSESFGPVAVKYDEFIRALHFSATSEVAEKSLPPFTKFWILKFVEGINYYVRSADELPFEFQHFNLDPKETWTVQDVLTISRLMAADFNWKQLLSYLTLSTQKGFSDYWKDFRELNDAEAVNMEALLSYTSKAGSNSFVLNGRKTQSKKPILAGDPHLGISLPNFWMIVGIRSPSYKVVGLMIPSMPIIPIGRNEDIAWGGTNMNAWSTDLVDVTAENPSTWRGRKENLHVRFGADKEISIYDSQWGPIISGLELYKNKKLKRSFAIKWIGSELSDEISSFLRVNKAKNWNEFQDAFDTYSAVGIYYTYADRRGNIALLPAAKLPQRNQKDRIVYHPEQDPKRWTGEVRLHRRLSQLNPASVIVSANNVPSKDAIFQSPFTPHPQRFVRITEVLDKKSNWKKDDILAVQKDNFSQDAFDFSKLVVSELSKSNLTPTWLSTLAGWDGMFNIEAKAPVLFTLIAYHLYIESFKSTLSHEILKSAFSSPISLVSVLSDKIARNQVTLKQWQNTLRKVNLDQEAYQTWGDFHRLKLGYPLGRLPFLADMFTFKDLPWPGTYDSAMKSVYQISNRPQDVSFGAQSRYVFDFSGKNENYFMLLGGQDGWMGSENFHDMADDWQQDRWMQIPLDIKEVEKAFLHKMEIIPLILHRS